MLLLLGRETWKQELARKQPTYDIICLHHNLCFVYSVKNTILLSMDPYFQLPTCRGSAIFYTDLTSQNIVNDSFELQARKESMRKTIQVS